MLLFGEKTLSLALCLLHKHISSFDFIYVERTEDRQASPLSQIKFKILIFDAYLVCKHNLYLSCSTNNHDEKILGCIQPFNDKSASE
jgi:hypothetical protein